MRMFIEPINLEQLNRKLRVKRKEHAAGCSRGLKRAALTVIRYSLQIVPVDTGHLRATWFVRHTGTGFDTEVRFGYTAEYAVYVHEIVTNLHGAAYNAAYIREIKGTGVAGARDARGKFLKKNQWSDLAVRRGYHKDPDTGKAKKANPRGENQQAKYLEQPIRERWNEMRMIVLQEMRIA